MGSIPFTPDKSSFDNVQNLRETLKNLPEELNEEEKHINIDDLHFDQSVIQHDDVPLIPQLDRIERVDQVT